MSRGQEKRFAYITHRQSPTMKDKARYTGKTPDCYFFQPPLSRPFAPVRMIESAEPASPEVGKRFHTSFVKRVFRDTHHDPCALAKSHECDKERACLQTITFTVGKLLSPLQHTIAFVPSNGVSGVVRECSASALE